MKFFCLIDYTSDVEAFQDGNLTDDFVVGLLLLCEVVVCQMTYSLKTVREGNFSAREQVQKLMGGKSFIC